ncbi:hypothetical protein F4779DRAFT_549121 [Xylariaceae sp. FL0662B]|nr:hypothetical protein F4779DRAFT_549121 [Xylariaceae sp. FL0662B]
MAPSPTKSEANGTKIQLNAREMEIVAKAWRCISEIKDGVVQVNCKKLAEIGPYASADSARHIWKPVQKKLLALAGAEATTSSSAPPTPSKGKSTTPSKGKNTTPRKRKADENGGEADEGTTPKKLRTRSTKAKAKMEPEDDDDDVPDFIKDEDFVEGEA